MVRKKREKRVPRVVRTAQNSKPPPLQYETIDSYTQGDTKYELRKTNRGIASYVDSSRTKDWTVYRRIFAEEKWTEWKKNQKRL